LVCAVAPAAQGQEGTAPASPAVSATVEQCVTASAASDRSVTFTAQMETVPGAHRMAMQIILQEHDRDEAGFHTLTAGGVGAWERSEVGVKIYKYVRQVTDLPAPAAYRAIVEYRWLSEKGHVIRTDERRTAICRQPDERSKAPVTPTPTPTTPTPSTTPEASPTPGTSTASAS
jgi:hypothetical protein